MFTSTLAKKIQRYCSEISKSPNPPMKGNFLTSNERLGQNQNAFIFFESQLQLLRSTSKEVLNCRTKCSLKAVELYRSQIYVTCQATRMIAIFSFDHVSRHNIRWILKVLRYLRAMFLDFFASVEVSIVYLSPTMLITLISIYHTSEQCFSRGLIG